MRLRTIIAAAVIHLLFTQFNIIAYGILRIFAYLCCVCFTNDNRFGRAMRGSLGNRNISGRLFLCPHFPINESIGCAITKKSLHL